MRGPQRGMGDGPAVHPGPIIAFIHIITSQPLGLAFTASVQTFLYLRLEYLASTYSIPHADGHALRLGCTSQEEMPAFTPRLGSKCPELNDYLFHQCLAVRIFSRPIMSKTAVRAGAAYFQISFFPTSEEANGPNNDRISCYTIDAPNLGRL